MRDSSQSDVGGRTAAANDDGAEASWRCGQYRDK